MLRISWSIVALLCLLVPVRLAAQDQPADPDMGGGAGAEGGMGASGQMGAEDEGVGPDAGDGDPLLGDAQLDAEAEGTGTTVGTYHDPSDPYEDPNTGYWFAGLSYRHVWVPQFILNMFLDEPGDTTDLFESASNPGFGAEVTFRKDNFSIVGNLFYAGYSARGPFRATGDPESDTEIIDSSIGVIFLTAAFLWSTPFSEVVALEYGLDIGLGVVFGDINRTEAHQVGGQWVACNGPSDPVAGMECDPTSVADGEEGGHYNVNARFWTDGGSVPNIVPWLAIPHLALRFKPVHQFQMRIEGGFGGWFFFGGSLSYGF